MNERERSQLVRFAASVLERTNCANDAEDVVHDSFIVYLEAINKGRKVRNPIGYVRRVTMNKCIDLLRKRGRETEELKDGGARKPDEWSNFPYVRQFVHDHCNTEEQQLFSLFYFEGATHREIAKQLAISSSTVHRRLNKLNAKVKEALL